mgnify:CR=1 FL=1
MSLPPGLARNARGPPPRGPPRGAPRGAAPPRGAPPAIKAVSRSSKKTTTQAGPPPIRAATKSTTSSSKASSSSSSSKNSNGQAPTGTSRSKGLTASQLDETKECFAMFDRDNDGYIVLKEVGVLMMSLGLSPTREELNSIMKKVTPSKKGHVSLEEFIRIVQSDTRKVSSGDEILEGFKIYDQMMSRQRDNGKISVKELRQVMTTFGEKLNTDEVEGMIGFASECTFNGDIDYDKFVDKMMNPNKYKGVPAI